MEVPKNKLTQVLNRLDQCAISNNKIIAIMSPRECRLIMAYFARLKKMSNKTIWTNWILSFGPWFWFWLGVTVQKWILS